MASVTENANEIQAIKTELANSLKLSELSGTQRRQVIAALFPNGVILNASDPQVKVGDRAFVEDFPNVNSGNFAIVEVLTNGPHTSVAADETDLKPLLG